jgi:flavin reductase (DIM6/NTAB) family NADH-FMN oxidoreductase RutF
MKDNFKEISANEFNANVVRLIGSEWMLITAGNTESYNTMTAAWGGIGFLWNVPVVFTFIRPQRYTYKFAEKNEDFTLTFFDKKYKKALNYCGTKSGRDVNKAKETGLLSLETENGNISFEQASVIIECKKIYFDDIKKTNFILPEIESKVYPLEDYHRMYIGRIEKVFVKNS